MSASEPPLLTGADPRPVLAIRRNPASRFVFAVDHAGAFVPEALDGLGIDADALNDHIGIDIGIFPVVSWLSALLDAPMVAQPFSRLVIDCNRRPGVASSIPEVSDGRPIPANTALTPEALDLRAQQILAPYQAEVAALLAEGRRSRESPPVLMAMHSFTRRMRDGLRREVDIGIIHHGANPLADRLIALLESSGLIVRRNEPYVVGIAEDYTVPLQAIAGGFAHIEIEICQDLIETCRGQRRIAELLWRSLSRLSEETLQEEAAGA